MLIVAASGHKFLDNGVGTGWLTLFLLVRPSSRAAASEEAAMCEDLMLTKMCASSIGTGRDRCSLSSLRLLPEWCLSLRRGDACLLTFGEDKWWCLSKDAVEGKLLLFESRCQDGWREKTDHISYMI